MSRTSARWFLYPDIHWIDRDPRALSVAMAAQRAFDPHYTVIVGDLFNCTPFTGHRKKTVKEAKGYNFKRQELEPASLFLDEVQKHTRRETIFMEGNHDAWIEQWLAGLGQVGVNIEGLFSLRDWVSGTRKKFRYVPYMKQSGDRRGKVRMHRDLYVVHGWSACKHAAAKHLELSRTKSILFAHTHRVQVAYGRDPWTGTPIVAQSLGCLCKPQPVYQLSGSPTQWVHAFGIAYVGQKSFTAYVPPVLKTFVVLPDGREVSV